VTAALDREQRFRQGRGVYTPPISEVDVVASRSDGTVLGAPLRWLRLEGATLLAGALLAFSTTRQAW